MTEWQTDGKSPSEPFLITSLSCPSRRREDADVELSPTPADLHRRYEVPFAENMAALLDNRTSDIVALAVEKLLPSASRTRKSVRAVSRVLLETALTRSAVDARKRVPGPDRLDRQVSVKAYSALYNIYALDKRWGDAEAVALAALECLDSLQVHEVCCSDDDVQLRSDLDTAYASAVFAQRERRTPVERARLALPHLERALRGRTLEQYQDAWSRTVRMLAESYADIGNLRSAFGMYRLLLRFTPERHALDAVHRYCSTDFSTSRRRKLERKRGAKEEEKTLRVVRQKLFRSALKYRMAMLILQYHHHKQCNFDPSTSDRADDESTSISKGNCGTECSEIESKVFVSDKDMSIENALQLLDASRESYSEETLPLWWASVKAMQGLLLLTTGSAEKDIAVLEKSVVILSESLDANPRAWRDNPYEVSEVYLSLNKARRELSLLKGSCFST